MTDKRLLHPGELFTLLRSTTKSALASQDLKSIPTRNHLIEEGELQFQVRVLQKPRKKPSGFVDEKSFINPFLPYEKALYVCHLETGHVVLLNKFNVVEQHLLIVTPEFKRQESLLSRNEFDGLRCIMESMPVLAFYNSAHEAGASQPHCHLQAIPLSSLPIDHAMEAATQSPQKIRSLPYNHLAVSINNDSADIYTIYIDLLVRLNLFHPGSEENPAPHNFLLTDNWIIVIPRSSKKQESSKINALGFAGLLLVKNDEQLQLLRKTGPVNLLFNASAHAGLL